VKATDVTEGLTQLHEAQRIVLGATPILGLEKISLLDALGRVLGEDIVAERDNPPWDNSAMDGFAVRWNDIKQEHAIQKPVTLEVIEDVPAGKMASKSVGAGQAIRIWSVPCSTGEEPYSIAIWLLENWPMVDQYEIEIVGSDIDTGALEKARSGLFGKRALLRLSPYLVDKYFVPAGFETWKILDDLRDSVRFSQVNIVEPAETRPYGEFDVIFCRNVLIYFDDASRRVAAENLYENLVPGGYICLGHTESMSRITPLFDVRRYADAIVYQRTAGNAHG